MNYDSEKKQLVILVWETYIHVSMYFYFYLSIFVGLALMHGHLVHYLKQSFRSFDNVVPSFPTIPLLKVSFV